MCAESNQEMGSYQAARHRSQAESFSCVRGVEGGRTLSQSILASLHLCVLACSLYICIFQGADIHALAPAWQCGTSITDDPSASASECLVKLQGEPCVKAASACRTPGPCNALPHHQWARVSCSPVSSMAQLHSASRSCRSCSRTCWSCQKAHTPTMWSASLWTQQQRQTWKVGLEPNT